jgi:cyclopropane fatty-acyl-phospholipid synthase-like methyltransferase
MNPHSDSKIVDSWQRNASQWTAAVRGGQIESRRLLTDKAIVDAVLSHSPESVLDIGCGEGWLVREIAPRVSRAVGVDAIPALIEQAKAAGGGDFIVSPYDAISPELVDGPFDVAVCNFSLLGKESVDALFQTVPSLLKSGGVFIVQTLHSLVANGDSPYVDGWRDGSWTGFSSDFVDPAPWYFRTVESWQALFSDNGLAVKDIQEPVSPKTGRPASIIFIAVVCSDSPGTGSSGRTSA